MNRKTEGFMFARADRWGHAEFDHTNELPDGSIVHIECDSVVPALWEWKNERQFPLVADLGIEQFLDFENYCRGVKKKLDESGLLKYVKAVAISEELYTRGIGGNLNRLIPEFASMSPRNIVRTIHSWLEQQAIPAAKRVFTPIPIMVMENYWYNEDYNGLYRPVPANADVLGIDPYIPSHALRATRDDEVVFGKFISTPVEIAARYRKPIYLIGQAFRAEDPADLWGIAPSENVLHLIRQFANWHPSIIGLGWFCYGSMPGVIGLRDMDNLKKVIMES